MPSVTGFGNMFIRLTAHGVRTIRSYLYTTLSGATALLTYSTSSQLSDTYSTYIGSSGEEAGYYDE